MKCDASGDPITSSVRGAAGLSTAVWAAQSGDWTPNGSRSSGFLVSREEGWICSTPSGRVHHHAASHGTSMWVAGPKGTTPAGLAQHSRPLGAGAASAGVHSGRLADAPIATSTMSRATQYSWAPRSASASACMTAIASASWRRIRSSRRLPAWGDPGGGGLRPSECRSTVAARALHPRRRISGTLVAAHVRLRLTPQGIAHPPPWCDLPRPG